MKEPKTIIVDCHKFTIRRSRCRCGSCPTEEILIEDAEDGTFIASYNIKSDYHWEFGEDYSFSDIGRLLYDVLDKI